MLAGLQRLTTVGIVLLALLWAGAALSLGRPGWACGGAALVVFAYAIVLAAEFVLLHRAHGSDPTPVAGPSLLLRAWWGEVRSAPVVFCWRQPFLSERWPDRVPTDARGRRGLLLVHGFVCNRGLWNPWLARLHARGTPFIAVDLEPVFGSIDDYIQIIERAVTRLEAATGLAPVVVAHSMGGLALRRWWAGQRSGDRLHHAVTIATPHHGTWLARFALTPNGRQMRRDSRWLQSLSRLEPPSRAARFTCFYGHCDNIVFPPGTATLAGADNRHLAGVAHVHMVYQAEPWQEVVRWLD